LNVLNDGYSKKKNAMYTKLVIYMFITSDFTKVVDFSNYNCLYK